MPELAAASWRADQLTEPVSGRLAGRGWVRRPAWEPRGWAAGRRSLVAGGPPPQLDGSLRRRISGLAYSSSLRLIISLIFFYFSWI
jgi:hypothetical protein